MQLPTDTEFNAGRVFVLLYSDFYIWGRKIYLTFKIGIDLVCRMFFLLICLITVILDLSSGMILNYSHQPPHGSPSGV